MRKLFFLSLLCIYMISPAAAVEEVAHVANLFIAGGQHYLDSDPSTFGGNLSLFYAPAMRFSRKTALIPVFNVDYRGTQDVQELVGGGVLTRQTVDTGLVLKYIKNLESSKLKFRLGYKKSLVNETKDEKWNKGLFDYSRILAGTELEKSIAGYFCSIGLDYYMVSFPNYASLVSEASYQSSIDTQTYTEISSNAGENVLDYSTISLFFEAEKRYSDSFAAIYDYRLSLNNYGDQTIVKSDGSFSSSKRKDSSNDIAAALRYNSGRAELSLKNSYRIHDSNQNTFDANATKFVEDFYSYFNVSFIPKISFYLGDIERPSKLSFWWDLSWQNYSGRLVQDANANYLEDKVKNRENAFGFAYDYPVSENISLRLQASRNTSSSNMKYEADYKYNYTVSNYYLGLNWKFGK